MDKDWFEYMFDNDGDSDKWGHQYRATQQIRLQKSFDMIKQFIKPNDIIVDLCCGLGDFLNKFNSNEYKLYGFDISNNAINIAKRLFPHINFNQNELPNIPIKSDIFISLECLYYLNQDKVLAEMHKNLNMDGYILVSVSMNYSKELLNALKDFNIEKKKYTYFGLFSKIEEKLVFYSKDLDYIVDRKLARKKYMLKRVIDSPLSPIIKIVMRTIRTVSLSILKSKLIVRLFSIIPIKRHIIVVAKKV